MWLLLCLFVLRVLGQMLVAFRRVSFLPSMEQWQSGLVPYRVLLAMQLAVVGLLTKVCVDFTTGRGTFVKQHRFFASGVLKFGYLYFVSMCLRYVVRMAVRPHERWFGGTIPIVFHLVLASFAILFGKYHRANRQARRPGTAV